MKKRGAKNQKGVATLLMIVVIAAAVLTMAYSASMLGLGELELGYTVQKGGEAASLADGCLEEALYRIRLDQNYGLSEGDISLTLFDGSCIIRITGNGDNRTISVLATIGQYYKKIETDIVISEGFININSWQEKED
ncbi:MAG: hypothetical protein ABIF89_02475 [bacterium]